ncbi:hypothetical protein AAF712_010571 [Marasmius tenuissimus]|uniref:Uncharacterized protein n=1 Tax=Marasmius tenuissimus TaxID=585030 RepID=A0ABR2ZQ68_9AGAR
MAPVMSTLIPTVEVFSGVNWRKWSKGLGTYAMINEFYDHYTNNDPEPDEPDKPTEPTEPKATTRTVTVAATTTTEATTRMETVSPTDAQMQQYAKDLEQYANALERYEKDLIRYEKDNRRWKKYEFKAMGALRATTTIAVQSIIEDDDTAWNAWEEIKAHYGQQTSVSVWADFKSVMEFRLSGGNPVPEIAKLELLFGQLTEAQINLPTLVRAMLLLSIIPQSWANAREFATNGNSPAELTFEVARDAVINHYESRKPAPLTLRISSVKKKDKDPKFNQQSNPPSSTSNNNNQSKNDNDQKKKNNRRGRKKKGDFQDNKGDSSHKGHSHIASLSHLSISSPPIVPDTPSVVHPADRSRDPLHMQCFSGATSGGTVFENAQAAHSLADDLGVPKYAHVLEPMEQGYAAASSSSLKHRIDGPFSTAPPAKRAKSIEKVYDLYDSFYEDSDSEREDRIALNAVNDSLRTEIASGSAMDVDSKIADAAGFSDDVEYDSVSIGSEESDDDRQVPYLSLSSNTDMNLLRQRSCPRSGSMGQTSSPGDRLRGSNESKVAVSSITGVTRNSIDHSEMIEAYMRPDTTVHISGSPDSTLPLAKCGTSRA